MMMCKARIERFFQTEDWVFVLITIGIILFVSIVIPICVGIWLYYTMFLWLAIPAWIMPPIFGSIALILLGTVVFTDPGVIPRREPQVDVDLADNQDIPLRHESVEIRGKHVELTYCYTCNFYRPDRAHHCSQCDHCVRVWDHHCMYIGTCIGEGNYRYFYAFLLFGTFSVVCGLLISTVQVVLVIRYLFLLYPWNGIGPSIGWGILYSLGTIILLLLLFPVFVFTLCLSGMHTFLICIGQTTYERVRGKKIDWRRSFESCSQINAKTTK
jgi:hypothetical protein